MKKRLKNTCLWITKETQIKYYLQNVAFLYLLMIKSYLHNYLITKFISIFKH